MTLASSLAIWLRGISESRRRILAKEGNFDNTCQFRAAANELERLHLENIRLQMMAELNK